MSTESGTALAASHGAEGSAGRRRWWQRAGSVALACFLAALLLTIPAMRGVGLTGTAADTPDASARSIDARVAAEVERLVRAE